jgi:MFS family permease
MLIPFFLMRACGRTPSATGWLLAPLGVGMLCIYPSLGALTQRFGIRRVSAAGALLTLISTLPFLYLTAHGFILVLLEFALFFRGLGQGAIGIPSITAAYASVKAQDLPMATATLNIAQRLGGPTFTTVCATFLAWRLSATSTPATLQNAFMATFVLLCGLHALLLLIALRLPISVENAAEQCRRDQADDVFKTATAGS